MARPQIFLDKFSPDGEFVVLRSALKVSGGTLKRGDAVPKHIFTVRRLRQMYDARMIGRQDGFVFTPPVRRKMNYEAALAYGFQRAAERDAAIGKATNIHLREQGDAVSLTPKVFSDEPDEIAVLEPPTEAKAEVRAVVTDEPAPTYDLGDMGLDRPAAPKPGKKKPAKKKKK